MENKKELDVKKMRKHLHDVDKKNWHPRNSNIPCTYCKHRTHADAPYCNYHDCCEGNYMLWKNDGTATNSEMALVFHLIMENMHDRRNCKYCEQKQACWKSDFPLCGGHAEACGCCKVYDKETDSIREDMAKEGEYGGKIIKTCKHRYSEDDGWNVLCPHWEDDGTNPEYSEMRRIFLEKGSLESIWHRMQSKLLAEDFKAAIEYDVKEARERREYAEAYYKGQGK